MVRLKWDRLTGWDQRTSGHDPSAQRFDSVNVGSLKGKPPERHRSSSWFCGCSSGVERDLPKVDVVGSNPITRSNEIMGT